MKMTRRSVALGLLAPAAAPAQPSPPLPADAEEELRLAREQVRRTAEALAKQAVPMATEPAFQFKA